MNQQIATDGRYEDQIEQLQRALTEGLQAINQARTAREADSARRKARARLQALGRRFASDS